MNPLISLMTGVLIALSPAYVWAEQSSSAGHKSPYAGFETRSIKSLSKDDISELRRGGGWGLALAAELNGVPGPKHLLEMKDEIGLSSAQVTEIESIFAAMKAEAISLGERLIAAEQEIEAAFVARNLTGDQLMVLIEKAAAARAKLRFAHLSRHLLTPPLLSTRQIAKYNALRGYGSDPCTSVPEGHNAKMWRKHNGCE